MNFCNPSKLGRSAWHLGLTFALMGSLAGRLSAQGVTDPSLSPAQRLEQLDGTYSSNLRKYHAPVILDYLRELEKLRQSYTAKGSNDEAAQVQAEIDKAKKLSTSTGLLSYDPLKPPPPKGEVPPGNDPQRGKGPRKFSPDAIMLATSSAINANPSADTVKPRPDDTALPIGHAEWHVEKIPAGIYEVMLICNMMENSEKMTVQATLGSLSVERKLPPSGTKGSTDFKVFRVGTITLDQDMTDAVLALESSEPFKPCIWVRNVILSHPKPPPGEGGPGGKPMPPPGGGGPGPGGPKPAPGSGPPPGTPPSTTPPSAAPPST
jgi:hypothetical protein